MMLCCGIEAQERRDAISRSKQIDETLKRDGKEMFRNIEGNIEVFLLGKLTVNII